VTSEGTIQIYKGFDYSSNHAQQIDLDVDAALDLTGATVSVTQTSKELEVLNAGEATQQIRFEFSKAETDALTAGSVKWRIKAVFGDGEEVFVQDVSAEVME
jgi:hypothetical protein